MYCLMRRCTPYGHYPQKFPRAHRRASHTTTRHGELLRRAGGLCAAPLRLAPRPSRRTPSLSPVLSLCWGCSGGRSMRESLLTFASGVLLGCVVSYLMYRRAKRKWLLPRRVLTYIPPHRLCADPATRMAPPRSLQRRAAVIWNPSYDVGAAGGSGLFKLAS